ncbi:MAG: hypothetical protein JRH15_11730 [Deltaproteobacteria bacterium]|nr:hypothetical protein [Deltaproteobacteria bacterium]
MFEILKNLDKRWVYLLMLVSIVVTIYIVNKTGKTFTEVVTPLTQSFFDEIDQLEKGDIVLLSLNYDPGSFGELSPMSNAVAYHCAARGAKLCFQTTMPMAPEMIADVITKVIKSDFPNWKYGEDYVNIGFKPGFEGVMKVIVTDLRELYTTDHQGTNIDDIPMLANIHSAQDFDLIVDISTTSSVSWWALYAATPYPETIRLIAGCTGVVAPEVYPYIPAQCKGLLAAIKGAAEYEQLVMSKYGGESPRGVFSEARRRMAPQLVAHILIILLVILANIIFFVEKKREQHQ